MLGIPHHTIARLQQLSCCEYHIRLLLNDMACMHTLRQQPHLMLEEPAKAACTASLVPNPDTVAC